VGNYECKNDKGKSRASESERCIGSAGVSDIEAVPCSLAVAIANADPIRSAVVRDDASRAREGAGFCHRLLV
jgi:hypothetical protein